MCFKLDSLLLSYSGDSRFFCYFSHFSDDCEREFWASSYIETLC